MVFDQTWEEIFRTRDWGKYPSEEVVRFVASKFPTSLDRSTTRILDLGCGGGAHAWFLAREGFQTYGIDGSRSGIRQTKALLRREGVSANLTIGDFTRLGYSEESFDGVIDANAIQHNILEDIRLAHRHVWRVLRPGGYFCGLQINTDTSGWKRADEVEENTFRNFEGGPIQKELLVHFFTESEVREFMAVYEEVTIERTTRTVGNGKAQFGHFVVVGRKPAHNPGS